MSDKTMSTILKVLYCLTLEGDVAVGLRDYLISFRIYNTAAVMLPLQLYKPSSFTVSTLSACTEQEETYCK